jgi:hypothetical protein
MFRTPRYLEKTEYIQFNLNTPLTFPGNNQHQNKGGKKFYVQDRDNVYDWENISLSVGIPSPKLFFSTVLEEELS